PRFLRSVYATIKIQVHLVIQGATAKRKKKWKGIFWFCFAVSVSEKSNLILLHLDCSFLRPHGDRDAPVSAFCGIYNLREPHTTAYA
ncbi:MAG: hypothetical protein NUV65_03135, partial [Candidatus Roizmanbacteria bacterium]|nr:hypothetical protein [Candidatus Roizmanbacteria bacterium]